MNTKYRYLYDIINEYSERILKTFFKLKQNIFVCTGSEANDLAIQLRIIIH